MKFSFDKKLIKGVYYIRIETIEILPEEKERIASFGVPYIPISPKTISYRGQEVSSLPLDDFKNVFGFEDESNANVFLEKMKSRIESAARTLRGRADNFSNKEEREF